MSNITVPATESDVSESGTPEISIERYTTSNMITARVAESENPVDGFISREKPVISPDKNNPYLNLCSGCIKVYELKDCYIGLQNGIFEKNGRSYSAIMLLKSDDGESFTFVKPLIVPEKKYPWMAQFVYACCMTYFDGKLRIYFNARNVANMVKGRESIGFIEAEI